MQSEECRKKVFARATIFRHVAANSPIEKTTLLMESLVPPNHNAKDTESDLNFAARNFLSDTGSILSTPNSNYDDDVLLLLNPSETYDEPRFIYLARITNQII